MRPSSQMVATLPALIDTVGTSFVNDMLILNHINKTVIRLTI